MTVLYIVRIALLVAPLTIITVYSRQGGWRYGFTFIQNSLDVGLYAAFAIAFLLGMYHVLSYELVGNGPMENYLKSRQKVVVKGEVNLNDISNYVRTNMKIRDVKSSDVELSFKKLVHLLKPDQVTIKQLAEGTFELSSEPFVKWWFIDFGRNFKTVWSIARFIKNKA